MRVSKEQRRGCGRESVEGFRVSKGSLEYSGALSCVDSDGDGGSGVAEKWF